MSSQDINGLTTHELVFQDEALRFNCTPPQRRVPDPDPKTRELSSFMDDKLFTVNRDRFFPSQNSNFRPAVFSDGPERTDARNWKGNGRTTTPSTKDSDDDEDDDDEDDDDVDEGLACVDDGNKSDNNVNSNNDTNNHSSGSVQSGPIKIGNGKSKNHSSFGGSVMVGLSREALLKDGVVGQSGNNETRASPCENDQQRRLGSYTGAVTIVEHDSNMYYSQYLQSNDGSGAGQKDLSVENGCGFSGRKDTFSSESGESLRAILSDPVTGALMDDAMILPCGHSFGSAGIQHVIRMKACYTCSLSISGDCVAPNLSLRAAVQAFLQEEELQFYRSHKRRRERFDQDKNGYSDSMLLDTPRGRGVQFPFVVTDRVIIKGNKRTPQRFVGREAVVTTQCLNGWYVVKTLDNAESVKLQYRSLEKVPDDSTSNTMSSKITPNWL